MHDMNYRDCADCRSRDTELPGPPPPDPAGFGPWFEAAHYGVCPGCGHRIEPRDTIRADGRGGWICEECGSAEPAYFPGTGHVRELGIQFAAGRIDTGRGA